MRVLVLFVLFSLAAAKPKPGGYIDPWPSSGLSSVSLIHQPTVQVAQQYVAQPVIQTAPAYAVAKPAATSYASFQQVVQPVAQHIVHAAPVVSQPVVHSAPVVHTIAQPVVQKYVSVGGYGGGYGGDYGGGYSAGYGGYDGGYSAGYGGYGGYGHGW